MKLKDIINIIGDEAIEVKKRNLMHSDLRFKILKIQS